MKRKIFLLCSIWNENYISELIRGIRKRIENTDTELHVLASYDFSYDLNYQRKEQEIFSLPDMKGSDGFLIASNSEGNISVIRKKIADYIGYDKKVLSIERKMDGVAYIGIDNYAEFYRLVEHILKEHNCKTLNYLGGPLENEEAQERFRAFCDCMQNYGLQVEQERVLHYNFLYSDGGRAYAEWKAKGLHLPDAVICANDNMALGYCDASTEDGYCAPDDFLITGFDNFDEGQYFCPSITSVNRNWVQMGYESMDILLNMIEQNDSKQRDFFSPGRLALNESCGCGLDKRSIPEDFRFIYHAKKKEEVLQDKQRMNRQLLSVSKNLKEMQKNLSVCFDRVGIDDMALCLNYSLFEEDMSGAKTEYDKEVLVVTKQKQIKMLKEQTFDSEYLTNIGIKKSSIYLYSSLHLDDDTYGYAVVAYNDELMKYDLHRTVMETASMALENIRQREDLNRMNRKLQQLYVQDPMTGLYNRFGYVYHAQRYLELHDGKIYLIYMDMDNLKKINDNYGHANGDRAISGIAQAIKTVFGEDNICVRMGGDEFLIMDSSRSEDEIIKKEEDFHNYLKDYSQKIYFPLELKVSMGHINSADSNESLEMLVKKADAKMYESKRRKKMGV